MSNPIDAKRPRSPLTLSKKSTPPQKSDAERARSVNIAGATLRNLGVICEPSTLSDLTRYAGTDDFGILNPAPLAGEFRRIKLARDRDRPLEFDGRILAEVEELTHTGQVLLRAAIYKTKGGKFITEMTRRETASPVDYGSGKRPFLFAKANCFDNLDLAAMSFRTNGGRLTERLLQQIGDVDSEFVE
jgi:hypothetical protein